MPAHPGSVSCTMRIRVEVLTVVFNYFLRTALAPLQPRPAVAHHASLGKEVHEREGFGRVDIRVYDTEKR